jgi:hypothetical protein
LTWQSTGPHNLPQRPTKPPTEAVFLRLQGGVTQCEGVFLRFLAAASFQKCGDSGDKLQELRIHAGLQRTEVRGQSGDKKGTKRGQYLYVKKNHSLTYKPPLFLPTLSHALADLVALPVLLAAPLPGAVCLLLAMACPVAPAFAHSEPPRPSPEMAAKRVSPWPTFAGRCRLALLPGHTVWAGRAVLIRCERPAPGGVIQRQQGQALDLVRCPVPMLTNTRPRAASLDTTAIPRDIIAATPDRGRCLRTP